MIDSGEACFDLGDAHSDLSTETVNVANLLLHLMEARKYSALLLGVHLSHGVQGAMEPPPLAFHLTFRFSQFLKCVVQAGRTSTAVSS